MDKPIVNLDELELLEFGNGKSFQARLGRIGGAIGSEKLGAQYHLIPPGKKAFPKHAHHVNEEMMVVISGSGTFHRGEESWPVREGDIISAPAGEGDSAHQMENTSDADLAFICISTRHDPEVVEYPDSGKFAVLSRVPEGKGMLSARIAYIGRADNSLDYFDGED